ncbi:hypothetical protein BGZ54_008732 [Gamsiella multidivaricata]|nr:hypothetical protein BGZ54_008732 [Gamsiella multidivaricata]
MNLIRLAEKIKSPLVFAHVRASSAGSVSESNCQPWQYGRLMFMHYGLIADFHLIKRKVQESLSDEIFLTVNGNTDSEWVFAVFLSQLMAPRQAEPFCHNVLKVAMLRTISKLNAWSKDAGISEASFMNFAVTDGVSVVCTRYINSLTLESASLYISSGTKFECYKPGHYKMVKEAAKREDLVMIASEPLTVEETDWLKVPMNTVVVITLRMNVLMYPIEDEFRRPGQQLEQQRERLEIKRPIVAAITGERRKDGARDIGHREVAFMGKDNMAERASADVKDVLATSGLIGAGISGDNKKYSNNGSDSTPSSPAMSSSPSAYYLPSSPSNSSMSTLSSYFSDMTVYEFAKDGDNAGVTGIMGRGHRIKGYDEDSEIEEDYRIFPVNTSSAPVMIPKDAGGLDQFSSSRQRS